MLMCVLVTSVRSDRIALMHELIRVYALTYIIGSFNTSGGTSFFNYICMDSSTITMWTDPFPIEWASGYKLT